VKKGKVAALKRCRAQILLKADAGPMDSGLTDVEIAQALGVGVSTVHRTRQQYLEEGLEQALARKATGMHRLRKLDGEKEARLVAVACGPAPRGRVRWTLRLLASKLVELEIVDTISKNTVGRTLKKTSSSPG
jgi:transposase